MQHAESLRSINPLTLSTKTTHFHAFSAHHLRRYSRSPTAFAPQRPDLVGLTHMEAPSGNTVNDIHDPNKPSNQRSKVDVSRIFTQDFPKLGPDLSDGSPYTMFSSKMDHEYH